MVKLKIAIDGPAAAGKSTVAREVARRLGISYLDTGAMYQAITLKLLRLKVELNDLPRIESILEQTSLEIKPGPHGNLVYLDGEDITSEIRQPYVTRVVSQVSAISTVRRRMVALQQKIAGSAPGIIIDGRDIASKVIPEARHKFYLDAALPVRARRRWEEQLAAGLSRSLEDALSEVEGRDIIDSQRSDSPLAVASDMQLIDTTVLTIVQVVCKIVAAVTAAGEAPEEE